MAFTVLLVPVPVADWLVADRQLVSDGVEGGPFPAHITLLTPFVPRRELTDGLLDELGGLFADVVPFSFRLKEVCSFPQGVTYLAPVPAAPFRHLTHALWHRFPEHAPYEGQFDDVVPHVTVPLRPGETAADLEVVVAAHVRRHGPLTGFAQEAQLVWVDGTEHEVLARFPFGTVAA